MDKRTLDTLRSMEMSIRDEELSDLGKKMTELMANIDKVSTEASIRNALQYMAAQRFPDVDVANVVGKIAYFADEAGIFSDVLTLDLAKVRKCTKLEDVLSCEGCDRIVDVWFNFDTRMNGIWVDCTDRGKNPAGEFAWGALAETMRSIAQTKLWVVAAQCVILRKLDC